MPRFFENVCIISPLFYGNATQGLCGIAFIIAKKAAAVNKKYKNLSSQEICVDFRA